MPKFLITWTEVQDYSAIVEFEGDAKDALEHFHQNIGEFLQIEQGDFRRVEENSIKIEEID